MTDFFKSSALGAFQDEEGGRGIELPSGVSLRTYKSSFAQGSQAWQAILGEGLEDGAVLRGFGHSEREALLHLARRVSALASEIAKAGGR